MSQRYASVLVVRQGDLATCPKAFRDYVEQYFAPKTLWGTECLYAVQALSYHVNFGWKVQKGAAPCHSVDISRFKSGLEPKQSLSQWIEQAVKAGKVIRLSSGWDDGQRDSGDDGD